jgi:hypothetical protein
MGAICGAAFLKYIGRSTTVERSAGYSGVSLLLCDFSTRKAIDYRNIVAPVTKGELSRLPLGHAFEAVVRAKWKFFQQEIL